MPIPQTEDIIDFFGDLEDGNPGQYDLQKAPVLYSTDIHTGMHKNTYQRTATVTQWK